MAAQEPAGAPVTPQTEQPAAAPASAPQEGQTPADVDSPEVTQKKQQLLEQLTFDRRPSLIMKAWAMSDEELAAEIQAAPNRQANMPGNRRMPVAINGQPAMSPPASPAQNPAANPATPAQAMSEEEKKAKEAAEAKVKIDEARFSAFQKQVLDIRIAVARSDWNRLRTQLGQFSQADREKIYQKLLDSLIAGPPDSPRARSGQIIGEKNLIRAVDVIAIGELCPTPELSVGHRGQLGQLVSAAEREGEGSNVFLEEIAKHLAAEAPDRKITRRIVAQILMAANRPEEALSYLPTFEESQSAGDLEAMDMLCDSLLASADSEGKQAKLEQAWNVVQAILEFQGTTPAASAPIAAEATTETPAQPPAATADASTAQGTPAADPAVSHDAIVQKALQRAVMLAPRLRKELGEKWLAESFTARPERGRRILSGIGTAVARNMIEHAHDTSSRVETLKLQQTAADAVLNHVKDDIAPWAPALNLMVMNWLREAVYSSQYDTSNSRGSRLNRDEFGNYYYVQDSVSFGRQVEEGMPQAIPSGKVLDAKPSDKWLTFLEPAFGSTYAMATARMHLRVKEEAEAFPHIESLAKTHPKEAKELLQNFIEVWSENNDPNSSRRRTNVYMYSFGYGERLNGIPLTRSHQERNLKELAEWVRRIRALNLPDVDDSMFAKAFMSVHSAAEVYRLDDMEAVFGQLDRMSPKALASFLTSMQANLGSVWRAPQVQQDSKTNRNQKDIEAEVQQGYESALSLCDRALSSHQDDWNLLRVKGAITHDRVVFKNDLAKSPTFAADRTAALRILQTAAEAYVRQCATLPENERSVEPFNTWFYAAMGDSSIGQITPKRTPMLNELDVIQTVLATIPAEVQDKHRDMFANDLFTRMSSVNPAVKFRYIREGLKLVGDRPQAREAKKVFEYYQDLVTEIQLTATIDGTANVGHGRPFGVLVSLRHTQAIERESGGFSRYLQNQNSGGGYYYNNGRPTEDYRDKFETAAREALDEHFEVLSVTFEPESIRSRPETQQGWRQTPYAYLLLKARGPEIDRIPPMRLDLDFLDTTGYVVLPVESPQLSINCSSESGDPRPLELVSLTQTLDEREADKGKLALEIKAVGKGILPDLKELVDLKFADFEVAEIEDSKLSVSKFDESSSQPVILTEHLWTVSLKDRAENLAASERTFAFPAALISQGEQLFQRYDDADLKPAQATVVLKRSIEQATLLQRWGWTVLGLLVLVSGGVAAWIVLRPQLSSVAATDSRWAVPSEITPFSVLSLLRDIERDGTIPAGERPELVASINQIERYFFAEEHSVPAPDLSQTALSWVSKAR